MKNLLPSLLLSLLILASCKKNDLPLPETERNEKSKTTSDVSGTIVPAEAVSKISISSVINGAFTSFETVVDQKGNFSFKDVPGAIYTVHYLTNADYQMILNSLLEVTPGNNMKMGDIVFTPKTAGSLSAILSPANVVTGVTATAVVDGTTITFTGKPNEEGKISFLNLPNAVYTLSFAILPDYIQPGKVTAVVNKGISTDAGKIEFVNAKDCGTVVGKVNLPGSATQLTLTSRIHSYSIFYATPDPATGSFRFEKVPSGDYTLKYSSITGLVTPQSSYVSVIAGQQSDIGTTEFLPTEITDEITCRVNGTTNRWTNSTYFYYQPQISTTFADGKLTILAKTAVPIPEIAGRQLTIKVEGIKGPGTYRIATGSATDLIGYSQPHAGFMVRPEYSTAPQGEGIVVIDEINETEGTITGTFSATMYHYLSGTSNIKREITDGKFKVRLRL